jgi:Protein of unknown function (DUF4232)
VNDLDDEVRDLLWRKAHEVPPHLGVPRSLKGRVRRRIALNALAVGTTVVVVVAGAFVGLRAFTGTTAQPAVTSPPPVGTAACTSGQLRAVGSMEGGAGSRFGTITLSNFSDTTCTLQGAASLTLLDQNLQPITSGIKFMNIDPAWKVDSASPTPPPGWPVVTLGPGDAASIRLGWSNWCPDGRAAPLWRVSIPDSGTVDVVNGMDTVGPPPCNGPGQPSTIEVGPFEPSSGA